MSNNYEDYSYEDTESTKKSATKKKILIMVFIIIAIVLIIFLVKRCSNGENTTPVAPKFNYETNILEAGKKYFENNEDEYPTATGACAQVDLETLISLGLVDPAKYANCNQNTSYVKVCLLEGDSKQWTPWLTCTDKNSDTEYEVEKEGTKSDLKVDESFVKFMFMPQTLKEGETTLGEVEEVWKDEIKYETYKTLASTTWYRYQDQTFIWNIDIKKYYTSTGEKTKASDVKEYYTVSPNANYNQHDSKTTEAYKWFTSDATKVYALGKTGTPAFSATPITGYPYSDGATKSNIYRTRDVLSTYEPQLYYLCAASKSSTSGVIQPKPCGQGSNANLTYQVKTLYSCKKTTEEDNSILNEEVPQGTLCKVYSDWSARTTKECKPESDVCEKTTIVLYHWYKLEGTGVKNYYPSNKTDAKDEIVYYTESPIEGAQKDTTTKATAYKWFKSTPGQSSSYSAVAPQEGATKTSDSKWTSWSSWSKTNPKVSDGRKRKIESKIKIKLQEIKGTTNDSWEDASTEYMTEDALIEFFKSKKYDVETLLDITNNGDIRYKVKMLIRNKKESAN